MNYLVRGTIDQPIVDGAATFHKASVSSPVLPRPLSNFGGTIHVRSNQLCINVLEGRVGRKGRLLVKGKLPLRSSEASPGDKIEMKSEILEVRAKNIFSFFGNSGQVDSQIQVAGSIMEPEVSGMIKFSHGEAYLPQEKGTGAAITRLASNPKSLSSGGYSRMVSAGNIARFYNADSTSLSADVPVRASGDHEMTLLGYCWMHYSPIVERYLRFSVSITQGSQEDLVSDVFSAQISANNMRKMLFFTNVAYRVAVAIEMLEDMDGVVTKG
eukprot:Gb_34401 [translate_table: standard]